MKSFFNLIQNKKPEAIVVGIIICILIYFPIFSFLGTLPIRIWDEARLAINAVEMVKSGNLITTSYESKPDIWNTKPPLMIWLQALSMKVIGINEFAVRLPSALAAFFTCLLLFMVTIRYSGNIWFSAITILILVTSQGYIHNHAVRTGDYDALLAFFMAGYSLCIFHYLNTRNKQYYRYFFVLITMAVLTKGIAGLLFLPGIFIFVVAVRMLPALLKDRTTWYGLFFFIACVGSYYLLRESQNPGYLKNVMENEIAGRYLSEIENHKEPYDFYFKKIYYNRFAYFFPLFGFAIFGNLFLKDKQLTKFSIFASILVISFLLIISAGVSKMEYYDLPIYPFMALVTGIFIYSIYNSITNFKLERSAFHFHVIPVLFLFILFFNPYTEIFNKTVNPNDTDYDKQFYNIPYSIKKVLKHPGDIKEISIVHSGYNGQVEFYRHMLEQKGIKSKYVDINNINDSQVIICSEEDFNKISPDIVYEELYQVKYSKVIRIIKYDSFRNWMPDALLKPISIACYDTCSPWRINEATNSKNKQNVITVFTDFESGMDCEEFKSHLDKGMAFSGNNSVFISKSHVYSVSFKCKGKSFEKYDIIEISGKIYSQNPSPELYANLNVENAEKNIKTERKVNMNNVLAGSWTDFNISFNPLTPYPDNSEVLIYLVSNDNNKLNIDDLRITFLHSVK